MLKGKQKMAMTKLIYIECCELNWTLFGTYIVIGEVFNFLFQNNFVETTIFEARKCRELVSLKRSLKKKIHYC